MILLRSSALSAITRFRGKRHGVREIIERARDLATDRVVAFITLLQTLP
jgi:hypothetical protein